MNAVIRTVDKRRIRISRNAEPLTAPVHEIANQGLVRRRIGDSELERRLRIFKEAGVVHVFIQEVDIHAKAAGRPIDTEAGRQSIIAAAVDDVIQGSVDVDLKDRIRIVW